MGSRTCRGLMDLGGLRWRSESLLLLVWFGWSTTRLTVRGADRSGEATQLPKSHTCFNRLDLPAYPSYEM